MKSQSISAALTINHFRFHWRHSTQIHTHIHRYSGLTMSAPHQTKISTKKKKNIALTYNEERRRRCYR